MSFKKPRGLCRIFGQRSGDEAQVIRPRQIGPLFVGVALFVLAASATAGPKRPNADASMPTEEAIDECQQRYSALRKEAEGKAVPIRGMREHPLARDELCDALMSYEEAQLKMIGFVDVNAKRCGLSAQFHQQLVKTYAATVTLKDKTCPKPKMRFG